MLLMAIARLSSEIGPKKKKSCPKGHVHSLSLAKVCVKNSKLSTTKGNYVYDIIASVNLLTLLNIWQKKLNTLKMAQNAFFASAGRSKGIETLFPLTVKQSPAKLDATQKTRLKLEAVNTTFIWCLKYSGVEHRRLSRTDNKHV